MPCISFFKNDSVKFISGSSKVYCHDYAPVTLAWNETPSMKFSVFTWSLCLISHRIFSRFVIKIKRQLCNWVFCFLLLSFFYRCFSCSEKILLPWIYCCVKMSGIYIYIHLKKLGMSLSLRYAEIRDFLSAIPKNTFFCIFFSRFTSISANILKTQTQVWKDYFSCFFDVVNGTNMKWILSIRRSTIKEELCISIVIKAYEFHQS